MNGILYVNKPKGITSFDLCNKIKRHFKIKKVGHTGTLDPNASGAMIVLLDNACKANQFLVNDKKGYIAKVKLGIKTDTLDIDGKIIKENDDRLDDEDITKILVSFLGKSKQQVPYTSAIKINGKKLYEYQRENIEIELPIRDIEIFEISLLEKHPDYFIFKCLVSKGTYIRVLAQDILNKINKIGTLEELIRYQINDINLDICQSLDEILNDNYHLYSLYDLLSTRYDTYEVDDKKIIMDGKKIIVNDMPDEILISYHNEALAIYKKEEKNIYRCIRGLL